MLVGRAKQPGRPVHGHQCAVVVGAEALQQPLDLEAVARQLALAHALGHRGALPNHRRGVPLRPDAAVESPAAEVLGAVAAVSRRQEREHAIQRGVERRRVAAPGVGEADEGRDLRRAVADPAGLRHREPQQRVGPGDLASGVGYPIDPETGANRPPVDPRARARQQPAQQAVRALKVIGLPRHRGETERCGRVGAVARERGAPAGSHGFEAVVLVRALGAAEHGLRERVALLGGDGRGGHGECGQRGQRRESEHQGR